MIKCKTYVQNIKSCCREFIFLLSEKLLTNFLSHKDTPDEWRIVFDSFGYPSY